MVNGISRIKPILNTTLNFTQEENDNKLFNAINMDELTYIKSMVEAGASLMAIDQSKNTPLHIAVKRGNLEIINTLLEFIKPEDENNIMTATNWNGNTPLHLAINSKRIDLIFRSVNHWFNQWTFNV